MTRVPWSRVVSLEGLAVTLLTLATCEVGGEGELVEVLASATCVASRLQRVGRLSSGD